MKKSGNVFGQGKKPLLRRRKSYSIESFPVTSIPNPKGAKSIDGIGGDMDKRLPDIKGNSS